MNLAIFGLLLLFFIFGQYTLWKSIAIAQKHGLVKQGFKPALSHVFGVLDSGGMVSLYKNGKHIPELKRYCLLHFLGGVIFLLLVAAWMFGGV